MIFLFSMALSFSYHRELTFDCLSALFTEASCLQSGPTYFYQHLTKQPTLAKVEGGVLGPAGAPASLVTKSSHTTSRLHFVTHKTDVTGFESLRMC